MICIENCLRYQRDRSHIQRLPPGIMISQQYGHRRQEGDLGHPVRQISKGRKEVS